MRSFLTFASLTATLALATASFAQRTTGTVKGYVVDEQGLALPGVTITLTSDSLMGARTAASDTTGFFRLSDLPPGLYRVEAELEGFGRFARENLRVEVSVTTPLDVVLGVAQLEEVVTVSVAAPVVETERTERQVNVNNAAIEVLPVAPRLTYQSLWQLAPGVSDGDTDSLGNAQADPRVNSAFQANETDNRWQNDAHENTIYIDGMDVNDVMSGKSTTNLSYEVIDEVNMKTAGFEAQFGTGRSAVMQVVTKSGGNEFHGSALLQFQPQSWNSTNVDGASSAQLSYYNPSLNVGGPIVEDRLWFFGSWRYDFENNTYPNTEAVDQLVRERRGNIWFGKLTYQANEKNRLSVFYTYDRVAIRNAVGDALHSTEAAMSDQQVGGHLVSLRWSSTISNTAMFELLGGFNSKPFIREAQGQGPERRFYDSFLGSLVRIDGNYRQDFISLRKGYYVSPTFSWYPQGDFGGRHEVKIGAELRPRQWASAGQFQHTLPDSLIYELRHGLDFESYGLSEPYLYEATSVNPSVSDVDLTARQYAVYLQDRWHPTPALTLNLGLRWEKQLHETKFRDQLQPTLEIFDPNIRDNVEFDDSALAPRFGVAYDLGRHGVARATAGRFHERVGVGDYNNGPFNQGFATFRVPVEEFGRGLESAELFASPVIGENPNFGRNLQIEYNDELTVGYERALPLDLAVDTTFIYRKIAVGEASDANVIFDHDGSFSRIDPSYDRVNRREFLTGDDRLRDVSFKSLQVSLRRNFTRQVGVLASYSHYWTRMDFLSFDTTETEQFAYSSPDDLDRRNYGPRWNFKLAAHYLFPGDILLSTFFNAVSGEWVNDVDGDFAWNDDAPRVTLPNGRVVPDIVWQARNSYWAGGAWGVSGRNTDAVHTLNIRAQKNFRFGDTRQLELSVDLYNAFNSSAYQGFQSADIRNPRYSSLTSPQRPRAVQANVRFVF